MSARSGAIGAAQSTAQGAAPSPSDVAVTAHYWNPAKKSASLVLTNSDATVAGTVAAWNSVLSITGHSDGFYYAEMRNESTQADGTMFGVGLASMNLASFVGSGADACGCQCSESPNNARVGQYLEGGYSQIAATGSINTVGGRCYIAARIDGTAGTMRGWFGTSVYGGWIGGGDPELDTLPTFTMTFAPGAAFYLAQSCYSTQSGTLKNNAGEFTGPVPASALPWG